MRKKYNIIRIYYTLSILLSAFLLFLIQPLFSKITLPLLGGATVVWSTAMVFFQGTLLLGYFYAHMLSKYLTVKWQVISHVCLCFVATLFLPLAVSAWFQNPNGNTSPFWLLALYAVSIGIPFFAVSANAPLLQSWYSKTNQDDSSNPYFLYAASNIGSSIALLGYPLVIEPSFTLNTQTILWSGGFFILSFMLIKTGFKAVENHEIELTLNNNTSKKIKSVPYFKKMIWVFYAFLPSALLLAFTNHITLDMASIPLFWTLPLFLYLMTFVIAFSQSKWRPDSDKLKTIAHFSTIPLLYIAFVMATNVITLSVHLLISLIAFFIITLYMHTKLAEERPNADNLTQFYVFQSLGGVLGGMVIALIVPLIFNGIYEFIILILISSIITTNKYATTGLRRIINQAAFPIILICASIFITSIRYNNLIDAKRSYFGAYKIKQPDNVRTIYHGSTVHGSESLNKDEYLVPQTYYVPESGVGLTLNAAHNKANIGIIGLGAGSLSCYHKPGQKWSFYEIDPLVVDLAFKHFSFMNECAKGSDIIIGDARISLAEEPDEKFDYLVIDAFSSDAIPIHLLTIEAVQLYFSKLKADGKLLMHVTNRFFDLVPPINRVASELNLNTRMAYYDHTKDQSPRHSAESSKWLIIIIERNISNEPIGVEIDFNNTTSLWTDNYSHLLGALK